MLPTNKQGIFDLFYPVYQATEMLSHDNNLFGAYVMLSIPVHSIQLDSIAEVTATNAAHSNHAWLHSSIHHRQSMPRYSTWVKGEGKNNWGRKQKTDRYHDLKSTVKSVKQGNITNHDQEEKTEKRKSRRNRSNRRWRQTLIS